MDSDVSIEQRDDKSFVNGVLELIQFRNDLEYLPASDRSTKVNHSTLYSFRHITRNLESAMGRNQNSERMFADHLNIASSYADVFAATGTTLTRAASLAPDLWAQNFQPTPRAPIPFGFAAGIVDAKKTELELLA